MQIQARDRHSVEVEDIEVSGATEVARGAKSGHYGYLVRSGRLLVESGQKRSRAGPGQIAWFGAGRDRVIRTSGAARWTVLRVRNRLFAPGNTPDRIVWESLMQLGRIARECPVLSLSAQTRERLFSLAGNMVKWSISDQSVALVMLKSLFFQFQMTISEDKRLVDASGGSPGTGLRLEQAQRALLLIDQEAGSLDGAGDLARRTGLSRSGLYRIFHASGLPSPAVMIEKSRLDVATRLLEESDRTVLDIAMATGFGSLSAFYRAFERAYGRAPGKWRESARLTRTKRVPIPREF